MPCSKAVALLVCCGMCGRQSETGAHSTWWLDANVQFAKGYKYPVLVVCWPSVQCGLVWLSRPVCQCARWRPVCAVSGLGLAQPSSGPSPGQPPPLPSPATRTPDHYQHQPGHMCRPSTEHSCINKKSQPEVELRESL